MKNTKEFQERVRRIESLLGELESAGDPASRTKVKELIQNVMDLHGTGLNRCLEIVSDAGEAGDAIIQKLGRDEIVSSLLVLYDIHPDDFETRVERGIEKARAVAQSRGASLRMIAIGEGTVRVRIAMSGHGCGSGGKELEAAVREILFDAAPDAVEVLVEETPETPASGFVPLTSIQYANGL